MQWIKPGPTDVRWWLMYEGGRTLAVVLGDCDGWRARLLDRYIPGIWDDVEDAKRRVEVVFGTKLEQWQEELASLATQRKDAKESTITHQPQ